MGEALKKLVTENRESEKKKREDRQSPDEIRALKILQREAKEHGATLESDGKGGLPSSLCLYVFRRDHYQCKRCSAKKNLTLHHKGHLDNPQSKYLAKMGKKNDPKNLVTLCADQPDGSPGCHDDIHDEDRANEPKSEINKEKNHDRH